MGGHRRDVEITYQKMRGHNLVRKTQRKAGRKEALEERGGGVTCGQSFGGPRPKEQKRKSSNSAGAKGGEKRGGDRRLKK